MVLSAFVGSFVVLQQSRGFSFAGGSGGDLVRVVAAARKAPVGMLVSPGRTYAAFTIPEAAPDFFRQLLNLRAGLARGSKEGLGLSPKAWPKDLYFLEDRARYSTGARPKPVKIVLSGGKATIAATESPVAVDELAQVAWTKPVRIHWFYEDAALWLDAKAAPEPEVVQTIAESLGASFRETKEEYVLGFDPRAYRARAIETLASMLSVERDLTLVAITAFTQEALRLVNDRELTALFAPRPEEAARKVARQVQVYSPRLANLARAKLYRTFQVVDGKTVSPSLEPVWEHHKRYVNWSLPPLVELSQSGRFGTVLRGTDYDGKPFQVLF